ncbi:hypothetical protein BSK20_00435 [SR1 bacterium human oral taxon HOT-345]|nr:hypothetical protein BSK20_00435 [SR1 bacterium human oral taxon HOT-345]
MGKVALLKKNIGILLLSPFVAFGIFRVSQQDWSRLTASVLDISEIETIEKQGRDVAYKVHDQLFELFGSKQLQGGDALIFELVYNPAKLSLVLPESSGATFSILEDGSGIFRAKLENLSHYMLNSDWIQIPFSGEEDQLVLSEAMLYRGENSVSLKIGNLSSSTEHSLLP